MGHAATHRPQRMQAVGWRSWASRWSKAKMALFCFKMGSSSLVMATPIMGPPIISFLGSALYPPQKATTSLMGVPTGTMTFWGWAMAEPSSVTRFKVRGMPVRI